MQSAKFTSKAAGHVWLQLLHALTTASVVVPRDQPTLELLNVTLQIDDLLHNIIASPTRRLNYRFMVAEWLWVWFGRNDLTTIKRYLPNYAQFSDDDLTLNGAYGIPFREQYEYVLRNLQRPATRQAVMVFWRPCPPESKDIPCTLTLQFLVRDNRLNVIANMRSSDVWLGLPYDIYVFSQITNAFAAVLGIKPGTMWLNLGSSHLYYRDLDKAKTVLESRVVESNTIVSPAFLDTPPNILQDVLVDPFTESNIIDSQDYLNEPWLSYTRILSDKGGAHGTANFPDP